MAEGIAALVAEGGGVRGFAHSEPVAHDDDGAAEPRHQPSHSRMATRASAASRNQRTSS
jgi:hypothetical protein